jgi:hypothetical protein
MSDFMVRIFGIGLAVGFGVWSVLKVWDLIRDYRIDNGHGGLANDGDDWAPFPACQSEESGQDYPGEGWRMLHDGETMQAGDQYKREKEGWLDNRNPTEVFSSMIHWPHRRRIITTREVLKRATGKRPDIEQQVCQDILDRQKLGIAKYGRTLADNPLSLRAWLKHAYEECLDQAAYLKRAIAEMDEQERLDRDK